MDTWKLVSEGFQPENAAKDGNRFLCANGYMGIRGVPEEAGREMFPAITLAGVYDQNGDKWREPVNAPNGLYIRLCLNGEPLALGEREPVRHTTALDYRHGVYQRETDFGTACIRSSRLASLAAPHLLMDRYSIAFTEAGEVEVLVGISREIWDINGPHLYDFRKNAGDVLTMEAVTGQHQICVAVAQAMRTDFSADETTVQGDQGVFRRLRGTVVPGDTWTIELYTSVYTAQDGDAPAQQAMDCAQAAKEAGWQESLQAHIEAWEQVWAASEMVMVTDDEEVIRALHASQYHLNCIAPRHAGNMSIPARGLSGQTYKGAIFWDSEMFFFPMFVHTQPEVARSLLRYRIETLPGALAKAKEYGYRGAFYAWESQEGGREGCTNFNVVDVFTHRPVRTWFRDKQIHISADIAYALRSYYELTGDRSLLREGGAKVILECARFYLSRANAHTDRIEIDFADVIGPDEYHERVTNNAYTNQMVRHCFESARMLEDVFADDPAWFAALLREMDYEQDWELLKTVPDRIRCMRCRDEVIEQFDGYFDLEDCSLAEVRGRLCDPREYWGGDHGVAGPTQIIKQADVIAMMALFPDHFSDHTVEASWRYYEPRTEHGSSLSACMYAMTACRFGHMEEAWRLFLKTAAIDVLGEGKQWAGEIYIGGTHPASNGGAWMIAALGFAGLRMHKGQPVLHPHLPAQVRSLRFPVTANGERFIITVNREGGTVEKA